MVVVGPGIDPQDYAHFSTIVMRFSFKGHNKLCASWLLGSADLEAEMRQAVARPLAQHKHETVRKVELVGCDHGHWAYNEWPQGLDLLGTMVETAEPEE